MTRTRSHGDRSVPCALRNGPPDVCEHGRVHSARLDAISRIPPPQDASFERRAPQSIAHQPLRSQARSTTFAFRHLAAGRPRAQDEPLVRRPQRPQRRRSVRGRRRRREHERTAPVPRTQHHLGQFAAAERGIRTAGAPERFTRAPALARDFYEFEFSPYGGEMAESGAMHRMRVP
ncbi:uncharacterized protein TRAVEDRAFT_31777, partial [Trametes versicolor FP-101664 SS1]|uniref:uncharacterized protein n=1 Tax=Trametes versicolor (strain FP-101664) TaxID=717944 RepID=UPI000462239C